MKTATNPFNDFVFVNATPADRGSFTLALDKALDKLEKFQLPDPSYFVLQWIQALVAAGSTQIHVQFETSFSSGFQLQIGFDGPGFSGRELQTLYDHVFLSGRDRGVDRLRELALGWLSASSLKPTRMVARCNGWERRRDTSTGGKDTVSPLPEKVTNSAPASGVNMLEVAGRGQFAFDDLLASSCTDVPIPLFLNGSQISHPGSPTGVPWPNRPFKNGTTQGVIGATYGHDSTSQIAFLRYGVNFVSRPEPALVPPVIIRASDITLSKNVSQTDIVKDDAYDDFLTRLRVEMKAMGLGLTGKRIPSYQRDALNRYLQAYIASHLDIRALEDPNRLALLGADYESLLSYPVFCSNKAVYRSLLDLHEAYKTQGSLFYCLDPQARAIRWAGMLLVLEVDEVAVLRKFFPNLINVPIEEIRAQSRMGHSAVSDQGTGAPVLARHTFSVASRDYVLSVFDCYPTGLAVIQARGSKYGTALPSVPLSLRVEFRSPNPPNHTEMVALVHALPGQLGAVKRELGKVLTSDDSERSFSRSRASELLCEILNFELNLASGDKPAAEKALSEVGRAPLIGLENGRLVSLADLRAFLKEVTPVYVGGAFVEGLESAALDPMPEAAKLLRRLYPPHLLVPTDRVRERLGEDADLRFALRRQAVIRGLGDHPDPKRAIELFASEAAAEAAELARIEREFRKAIDGPTLFVKPDETRLAELEADLEDQESLLLDLTALGKAGSGESSEQVAAEGKDEPKGAGSSPAPLPSLEEDIELCRQLDADFFPAAASLHVERRESHFTLHLCTSAPGTGKVVFVRGDELRELAASASVRGFVRLCPTAQESFDQVLAEGIEQLTVKAIHAFGEGPPGKRMRRALRAWLLEASCLLPGRLLASADRRGDLFDLPVLSCLGGISLSWRALLDQALRTGETPVWRPEDGLDARPCSNREVLRLVPPLTERILEHMGFPALTRYLPQSGEDPFETLYRSTRRDLSSVLSGGNTPLLRSGIVEQMAADASLWKRWRSGFLSWDSEQSVAVMNPGHKIGKSLVRRFSHDPSWSRIFASALFSTINRGLAEVEDQHERAFLEGLVDTLD